MYKAIFEEMPRNYSLKGKHPLEYNPQSNGIDQQLHQVLGNMLRTFKLEENELNDTDPWSKNLASGFAICLTYHATLGATLAQLVFGCDMLLPIRIKADWVQIKNKRQLEINRNNECKNRSHICHTYSKGDKVTLQRVPGIK